MPLSSQLSAMIRRKIQEVKEGNVKDKELSFLQPLFELQLKHSAIPGNNELLIEYFETAEGYHLLIYPFEGRSVHEGLGALLAYRIGQIKPLSFSIGMTDYGVELLSAEPIPVAEALEENVLSVENLLTDVQASINATEMAKRKFRDIAAISGLIFKGFPGQQIKDRHLQSSTQLFFSVFADYESSNLLLQQAYSEVLEFQLEETRLRQALARMATQKIILKEPERPTPFSFPIMVDRLREKLSTESLEAQVKKMVQQYQQ
jgi:ATP-dependent Lhr-like helicase